MTTSELRYAFKLAMDRVDSLNAPDFNVAQIDWLLNEAQLIFIKQRMSMYSNPKQKGFEQSQKRIDDLGSLVVKFPQQPGVVPTNPSTGVYELSLSSLTFTYLFLVSAWADVTINTDCTKSVPLKFMQHDDYRLALKDPFNKAGEEFIPYNIGKSASSNSEAIFVYSDYPIETIYTEYVRYPSRVSSGSYQYIDGNTYPEQSLQTPNQTHSEIVDIACMLAGLSAQNPEYIQLKSQKLLIHE
jgi:hypothetical protein